MKLGEFVELCKGDIDAARGRSGPFGTVSTVIFRLGQFTHGGGLIQSVLKLPYKVLDTVWLRLLMGAELPASLSCGPRLVLCHGARGIIVNPRTKLGSDVTILHQVTIGNAAPSWECPTIGDGVFIGAKSSIIGKVSVGDGSTVGAHALVTKDVPASHVARGVPAINVPAKTPSL